MRACVNPEKVNCGNLDVVHALGNGIMSFHPPQAPRLKAQRPHGYSVCCQLYLYSHQSFPRVSLIAAMLTLPKYLNSVPSSVLSSLTWYYSVVLSALILYCFSESMACTPPLLNLHLQPFVNKIIRDCNPFLQHTSGVRQTLSQTLLHIKHIRTGSYTLSPAPATPPHIHTPVQTLKGNLWRLTQTLSIKPS